MLLVYLPPRLTYNPDKAVILQNERTMRQHMGVDIRKLGWQWRYPGCNRCSDIGKWFILTTAVLFCPALILTSEHNQNGLLTPIPRSCYNVVRYHSTFRYIKIRSTF
jgi:hypothetical protein